ncbi:hypothetical protein E4U57_000014 [Claviceps arundinis]|uniref:Uncharacterized protein n=1 Tax=Claviceps arundinis TaxID=1623583 RepID=A0ABQ7PSG3_9HYPO|nr:hypothetical protein E4U57_000014 [Claviceps arundinis]
MKFSSVLGTFALSTLEAYRAYAIPAEPGFEKVQSLERSGVEACCVMVDNQAHTINWTKESRALVTTQGQCKIFVNESGPAPSAGGCDKWRVILDGCPKDSKVQVMSIDICLMN